MLSVTWWRSYIRPTIWTSGSLIFASSWDQRINDLRSDVNHRFDDLKEWIRAEFRRVDERIDHLAGRLEKVAGRFENVEGRLEKVEGRLGALEARFEHPVT